MIFQQGTFLLHSGQTSTYKIDCDYLDHDDWQTLATMLVERIHRFSTVEGIPSGGIKLAQALVPFCDKRFDRHLIVDDVTTTGSSLRTARSQALLARPDLPEGRIIGAVVFAREHCPDWVTPLFQMPWLA